MEYRCALGISVAQLQSDQTDTVGAQHCRDRLAKVVWWPQRTVQQTTLLEGINTPLREARAQEKGRFSIQKHELQRSGSTQWPTGWMLDNP